MDALVFILLAIAIVCNVLLLIFRPKERTLSRIEFVARIVTTVCLIATLVILLTK